MTANQETARDMQIVRRAAGWFVTGLEIDLGPYRTKAEASEDREGVRRTLRFGHRRGFVTVEK